MSTAAAKLLESATVKTLHAHNFSRSSAHSLHALTDLLARYLLLLSETSAKYAHHAGRSTLTARDALAALEEIGVGLDELEEYCAVEAKELNRYAQHSTRRAEDLNDFKAQLAAGLSQDHGGAMLLEYRRCDPESQPDSDDDLDVPDESDKTLRSPSPQLPLSPRKRPRTANWKPPSHVPAFLPPFPSSADPPPTSIPSSPHTLPGLQPAELMPPPLPPPPVPTGIEKPALAPPVTQAMTASATSDYFDQVPYNQSSLSSVPEWHLPTPPSTTSSSRRTPKPTPVLPTLQTEPVLFKAYHHILTHRPPASPPPSTLSRHKVAMAFLSQTQNLPRWDSADTLFSTVAPCPPRVAVIGPSFPVAINDSATNGKVDMTKDKEFRFPPTIPRPVSGMDRLTPLLGHQTNRIPELARHVLPPVVMNRITRLAHPPVLHRGTKPLYYGRGIPAPWNSHAVPSVATDGNGVPPTPISITASSSMPSPRNKLKDRDTAENGGESGTSGEGGNDKLHIPDAQLFATWDFETKDFKVPLPMASSVMMGPASRLHRGKVSREVGGDGAGVGAGGSAMMSLPTVGASGRLKSGLRS